MVSKTRDTLAKRVRKDYNQNIMDSGLKIPSGLYQGIVVDNKDPMEMGRVRVQISKFYGIIPPNKNVNPNYDDKPLFLGAQWCRVLLPIGGTTELNKNAHNAYGINGFRPDKDNEVLVAFSGDSSSGIVIGVLPEEQRISQTSAGPSVWNKRRRKNEQLTSERSRTIETNDTEPEVHPQQEAIKKQGLDTDRLRGLNYSSVSRDSTPRVLGITSRKGHAFVLDDGNEQDEKTQIVRLRTSLGAQILMDDTNGFLYIINRDGTAWMQLDSEGTMDVYSEKSSNMATPGDINFNAGGNFNLQAGRGINIKSLGEDGIKVQASVGEINMYSRMNMNLTADLNGNIKIAGNFRVSSSRADVNGPTAATASKPKINQLVENKNTIQSVCTRCPESEPYGGHKDQDYI